MTAPQTALILGPTGKFGRNAAAAFSAAGWETRLFNRKTDDLTRAATGVDVIVMGWHPPTYDTWERDMPLMHQPVIDAAKASGAAVVVPTNVYVFGPDAPFGWSEDTPHRATNPLGRLRIEVEEMYRTAGVQTILLRCGDFIDTQASGNWFDRFITTRAQKGSIAYPGRTDIPHAWAYLPDAARAAVMLAERRETLATFEDVPFEGYTLTGSELAEAIGDMLHRPVLARPFPWWQLKMLRPFMPVLNGVFEMRYLWDLPQSLDGTKLGRLCPEFTPTPIEEALRHALAHQMPGEARGALAA